MKRELSILIPTYNYNTYPLVETLYREAADLDISFEILVFDDGSVEKFSDHEAINALSHCTYQYRQENVGRSLIRKELAKAAAFNTLLYLDADVLPANKTFLRAYLQTFSKETEVICGGITYESHKPAQDRMLRYHYGLEREAIDAEKRQKTPWFIFTGNLCIDRDLFNKVNTSEVLTYGEDLLISQNLKKLNTSVIHIDNPVVHLGIEYSEDYIKKSLEGLEGLVAMERSGDMDSDFTKLQQKYRTFKSSGTLWLLNTFTSLFRKKIIRNLQSPKPNLRYFDLYRLWYYSKLKKNA